MKIRTQLVLACFFLSVVPLAGIVLYSYRSSRQALETAYHNEASRMTRQMDHRLAAIRSDLEQRLAELSALPLQNLPDGAQVGDRGVTDNVLLALGDTAKFVDSLELRPLMAHRALLAPRAPQKDEAESDEAKDEKETSADEVEPPDPPEPPDEPEPIVIDIPPDPKIPQFVMSKEQNDRLRMIGDIGAELGRRSATMTKEEREALLGQMRDLQAQVSKEMEVSRMKFHKEMADAMEKQQQRRQAISEQQRVASEELARKREKQSVEHRIQHVALPAPPAAPTDASDQVTIKRNLTVTEKAMLKEHDKRGSLIFGQKLNVPLRQGGTVVGNISAQVKPEEVLRRVLGNPGDDGELAFAADRDGNIYTRTPADRKQLDELGVSQAVVGNKPLPKPENWIVAMSKDRESGLRVGVARPVGEDLGELRRAAGWNFSAGIGLIVLALIGIVPVANHLTRDVELVTAGAERIAHGDLMTRLPVRSKNEFGQLSAAFNKMAHDLSHHQETILQQERSRKEQEMQQQILELEYDRKSVELEDARRFQLSMLPKVVPQHEHFDIAVFTRTATEVGGDYYDFHLADDGVLSVTVGDATGHGAKAGTMVTVVKTLFASYTAGLSPAQFLRDSAEKIKRMDFGRMAMSLLLARFEPRRFTIAAAGMPPALVYRAASGMVEELAFAATPLGTLGSDYSDRSATLDAGDTVLLLTDGFPELLDPNGHQLGYPAALDAFAAAATESTADGVIAAIAESARKWHGDNAPNDDITFVVVRAR